MSLIKREDVLSIVGRLVTDMSTVSPYSFSKYGVPRDQFIDAIDALKPVEEKRQWIPTAERLPEHSYGKRFWLTVKTDDGHVETVIGAWSAWQNLDSGDTYDAFDCWKDVLINGFMYKIAQPIPKENVIAWMPLPPKYEEDKT